MELLGYIIGGLHLAIGILITVIRNLDDALLLAKEKIQTELFSAYKEFGNVSSSETLVESGGEVLGPLENASSRLMRIHYSSNYDVVKLRRIEWICDKTLPLIIFSIVLVVASALVGRLLIDESDQAKRSLFIVVFPSSLFFLELIFLYFLIRFEKYLKRLRSRYASREY